MGLGLQQYSYDETIYLFAYRCPNRLCVTLPENGIFLIQKSLTFFTRTQFCVCQKINSFLFFFCCYLCCYGPKVSGVRLENNPLGESFCFSGQPVVKGTAAYKTQLGGEKGNQEQSPLMIQCQTMPSPSTLFSFVELDDIEIHTAQVAYCQSFWA